MLVNYFLISEICLKNEKNSRRPPLQHQNQNLLIVPHLSESIELPQGGDGDFYEHGHVDVMCIQTFTSLPRRLLTCG